jgi:hypothetical protein
MSSNKNIKKIFGKVTKNIKDRFLDVEVAKIQPNIEQIFCFQNRKKLKGYL